MFRFSVIFLFTSCLTISSIAQPIVVSDEARGLLVNISFAGQLPEGDLADRFGANLNVGGSLLYMTTKKWLFGAEGGFMFGNSLKEDVLINLRTSDGNIIGSSKQYADVISEERGRFIGITVGKIIPIKATSKRSGLRFTLSIGVLEHKIRIDDQFGEVPQLAGEYMKGYDRLTNGLAITEFIGYQHFSKNRLVNYFVGFEFTQGFTKSRRSFNYDTMETDTKTRTDLLYGLRVGWTLPLYTSDSLEEAY